MRTLRAATAERQSALDLGGLLVGLRQGRSSRPRSRDERMVTEGKETSRSSLTARRRRVNAARAAAIRDLIGFKIVNLRLGHFRLPRVTSHELALEQVGEHKIPKTR